MNNISIEKFYVYRSLNNDETWGCIFLNSHADQLPNIDFGMKVYARNEKEAITRAKKEYDKIHSQDSDKENIRRFASSALKTLIKEGKWSLKEIAKESMDYATALNDEYKKYFQQKEETCNEEPCDNEGHSG